MTCHSGLNELRHERPVREVERKSVVHQKEAPALRIALEASPPNADAGLIVAPEKFLNHDTGLILERAGHRGDRAQFAVVQRH